MHPNQKILFDKGKLPKSLGIPQTLPEEWNWYFKGASVLSDVFAKVNNSISPCKAVMVEASITSNQLKLIHYTQDLYHNEKPHSSA